MFCSELQRDDTDTGHVQTPIKLYDSKEGVSLLLFSVLTYLALSNFFLLICFLGYRLLFILLSYFCFGTVTLNTIPGVEIR